MEPQCTDEPGAEARTKRGEHVVDDAQLPEWPHDLKCASNAELGDAVGRKRVNVTILEPDLSAAAGRRAAEQIEERSLARPIGSDHAEDFPRKDLDVDAAHRDEAAEPPREVARLQQAFSPARGRRTGGFSLRLRSAGNRGARVDRGPH